jgi:hypothetical protein
MKFLYSSYLFALASSAALGSQGSNEEALEKPYDFPKNQTDGVPTTVSNSSATVPVIEYCRSVKTGRKLPRTGLLRYVLPHTHEKILLCARSDDSIEIVERNIEKTSFTNKHE